MVLHMVKCDIDAIQMHELIERHSLRMCSFVCVCERESVGDMFFRGFKTDVKVFDVSQKRNREHVHPNPNS